jgi:hypothetical protein
MALTSVVKMENYRLNWEQARLISEGRHPGADPETLLTWGGGLSYGAIFSIIDGTNCSPKAVLACRSVNLVFISFSVQ